MSEKKIFKSTDGENQAEKLSCKITKDDLEDLMYLRIDGFCDDLYSCESRDNIKDTVLRYFTPSTFENEDEKSEHASWAEWLTDSIMSSESMSDVKCLMKMMMCMDSK